MTGGVGKIPSNLKYISLSNPSRLSDLKKDKSNVCLDITMKVFNQIAFYNQIPIPEQISDL